MFYFKEGFIEPLEYLLTLIKNEDFKKPFEISNNRYIYDDLSNSFSRYRFEVYVNYSSDDDCFDVTKPEKQIGSIRFDEFLQEQLTYLTQWFEINFNMLISSSSYTNEYKILQLKSIDLELNRIFAKVTKSLEIQFPALKETYSYLSSYLLQRRMLFDFTASLSGNKSQSINLGPFIHQPDIIKKVKVRNAVLSLLKDSKLVDKQTKASVFEKILSGKSTERMNWLGNVAELKYFTNELQKHEHFQKGTKMYIHVLNYFSALNSQGEEVTNKQLKDAGEPRETIKANIDLIIKTIKTPPSIKNKLEK